MRNTDSEHRLPRPDIYSKIRTYLPNTEKTVLETQINSALNRLTKRYVRHWDGTDEFCLTYDESERLKERLAIREEDETMFLTELDRQCEEQMVFLPKSSKLTTSDLGERVRRVLDEFLLERGEVFAVAVASERLSSIGFEGLPDIIIRDIDRHRPAESAGSLLPDAIRNVINRLVTDAVPPTQKHLRCLSDSYTLFAFLCEVSDVQRATRKMFSHGEIWLDTTVILPLFAEVLLDEEKRTSTRIFRACIEAGITLRVTEGVVIEVDAHMNISEACSREPTLNWRGRVPFLYYRYIESGRKRGEFSSWLELFRGSERPLDDITDYLTTIHDIKRGSLKEAVNNVPDNIRFEVQALWLRAHELRRGKGRTDYKATVTTQLVNHDVENYIGVIGRRKGEKVSEFGYKQWWLTLDQIAWHIRDKIELLFRDTPPSSPLLGLDFLINHLSFGASRGKLSKETEQNLPIIFDFDVVEFLPKEMLEVAERIREEGKELPEYVIRRRIRDEYDKIRRQRGPLTEEGIRQQTLEA